MNTHMKTTRIVAALFAATLATGVYAAGNTGTAKPPPAGTVPTYPAGYVAPAYPALPPIPVCNFLAPGDCPSGFAVTGFIQNATSNGPGLGGTAQVNGITYTIPDHTILQMPANTLTWNDFVNPTTSAIGGVGLNSATQAYPAV